MRNVLAITMALMLAAVILSPAAGYTIQSGTNVSYSIGSTMVNYTFHTGEPASNLTPASIPSSVAPTSAVTVTRVPYSIKLGAAVPYSIKEESTGTTGGISLPAQTVGTTAAPSVEVVGQQTPTTTQPTQITAPVENVTAPAPAPAPGAVSGNLSIMGLVYDDTDGNGVKEANESGLATWTINLEQPEGTIIATTMTNESGSYALNDLSPGEYYVYEILPPNWSIVSPEEGYATVNLTDMNAENVDFANKMVTQGNVTATANMTMPAENTTA
jgi:hypothetical protein